MSRLGEPPEEYLRQCSSTSLRYFEMSKLEHVANLRRELSVLLEEMMEESALALFARWMLEKRSLPAGSSRNGQESKAAESRRARSLLADFMRCASLAAGTRAPGDGSNGRPRGEEKAPEEGLADAGLTGRGGDAAAKEHLPPGRGATRAERRKSPRAPRPGGPFPAKTP